MLTRFPSLRSQHSTGHQGRHGHEFLEFEYSRGRLRYANNSNYRNDSLIRKESKCGNNSALLQVRSWLADMGTSFGSLTACYSVDQPADGRGATTHRRGKRDHAGRRCKVAQEELDGPTGARSAAGQGTHFVRGE